MKPMFLGAFRKWALVGVLFLVGTPLYVHVLEPHRDLRYHLLPPPLVTATDEDQVRVARADAWVQVEGTVAPESVHLERVLAVGPVQAVLFQLQGVQGVILAATRGPTFQDLQSPTGPWPTTFRGRLYPERNAFRPFGRWVDARKAGVESYMARRRIPKEDSTPRLFRRGPEAPGSWLLVVGEDPSPLQLPHTHLPVFLLGWLLGILGLVWVWFRLEPRARP